MTAMIVAGFTFFGLWALLFTLAYTYIPGRPKKLYAKRVQPVTATRPEPIVQVQEEIAVQ